MPPDARLTRPALLAGMEVCEDGAEVLLELESELEVVGESVLVDAADELLVAPVLVAVVMVVMVVMVVAAEVEVLEVLELVLMLVLVVLVVLVVDSAVVVWVAEVVAGALEVVASEAPLTAKRGRKL